MNTATFRSPHLVILGALTLLSVLGIIVLAALKIPEPEILSTIAIAAASAVAGLAVPSGTGGPSSPAAADLLTAVQSLVHSITAPAPAPDPAVTLEPAPLITAGPGPLPFHSDPRHGVS